MWELRTGDFRDALADLADQCVDACCTDPPYDAEGVPLYEPLGTFAFRVLKPGRLAVVYAGDKPPSLELARWHYKKALALGLPKGESLDKLLEEKP